ncbi:hypothetical protein BDZ45DRAFT_673942 [Acephala macrosclerotiorum]|nr:hypothetical protein BDZ45DRAFT_673942 [Acephala macrosclerotiorum]
MSPTAEEKIASRQRFSDRMAGNVEEALEKLDANPSSEFDVNIESMIMSCNHRFKAFTHPPGYWAIDLHDLWRLFIWCAKGTPADDTRQDMRASQIVYIRELGVVISTETEPREALTEEGERIWVDLPYLTADFYTAWESALGMKPSHMNNLAAFTARLVEVGVRADELAFCMLQLCKQVLETEQPAIGAPLDELLPAVFQWFKHCGEKLKRLCISNHTVTGEPKFDPGPLAQAAGVHKTGFSVDRWLFWRKIVEDFAKSKDEKIAVEGKRIFNQMMMISQFT